MPSISTASEAPNSAKVADSEASSHMFDGTYGTPMSQFSGPLNGDGPPATNDLGAVLKVLKKKVQRLTQAREEARAESFAQASIAVQRGIEIDNLSKFFSRCTRRRVYAPTDNIYTILLLNSFSVLTKYCRAGQGYVVASSRGR